MATEKMNIEEKLKNITDTTTEIELNGLKNEIGCLEASKIARLREIIEQKNNIKAETKQRLQTLLLECSTNVKSPEKNESKDRFDEVFHGTKSEMLSKEHVQSLKVYILSKFENTPITSAQKDNLATATIDRLLSDADFIGVTKNLTGGLTSAIKGIEKSGITGIFSSMNEEKPVSTGEVKTEVEGSATGVMKRIMEIINRATLPLVELLKTRPTGLESFLANPRAIALYDGSGKISQDIMQMSPQEKGEYIKNLNNRVLEIDGKIVPLEALREKGMDAIATAPNWMQDIFKWLLSLPLIGNLLASFLGYKGGKEALGLVDEELRQRTSIMALREFGKTIDMTGKEKDGKNSDKISTLKGADLSGLNYKKLKDFFTFTKDSGISIVTSDQWINLFEKGILLTQDKDGKEVKYTLEKNIVARDLDKNFEGLYQKLNGLLVTKNNTEYQKKQEGEKEKGKEAQTKKEQAEEAIKQKNESEKRQKTDADNKLQPYRSISEGVIINESIVKKLSALTLTDFIDGSYQKKAENILQRNANKDMILGVLKTYSNILSHPNMESYKKGLKSSVSRNDVDFTTISFQRKNMLVAHGISVTNVPEALAKVTIPTIVVKKTEGVPEKEVPKDRKTLLADAFMGAGGLPIAIEYSGKKEVVNFINGELQIGDRKFSLAVQGNGLASLAGILPVTNITFNGDSIRMAHANGPSDILRTKIAEGIPRILELEINKKQETSEEKGTLIVTRIA